MKILAGFFVLAVLTASSHSKPASSEEADESVVSIYTTDATVSGAAKTDVYHQIANNIAEKIAKPIYRFLGINPNKTEEKPTQNPLNRNFINNLPKEAPLKPKSQNLDSPDKSPEIQDNEIDTRDIEELSDDVLKKLITTPEIKPEKITLFNSYLPLNVQARIIETTTDNNPFNDQVNNTDIDNELSLDQVLLTSFSNIESTTKTTSRQNPFVFILELLGSLVQLAWGAFSAIFTSQKNSDRE